jgi:hypothetical protein
MVELGIEFFVPAFDILIAVAGSNVSSDNDPPWPMLRYCVFQLVVFRLRPCAYIETCRGCVLRFRAWQIHCLSQQ